MNKKQTIEVTPEEAVMLRRVQKAFRSLPPEKRVETMHKLRCANPYLKQMLTELLINQGERLEEFGDVARLHQPKESPKQKKRRQ
jgi:hypothetical protein